MRLLKTNAECLGGKIIDIWYENIPLNRGSFHLHMLLWCENIPDCHISEGL